jgi:hypothetical protein
MAPAPSAVNFRETGFRERTDIELPVVGLEITDAPKRRVFEHQ